MKKIISVLMQVMLALSLSGCQSKPVTASSTEYGQAEHCLIIVLDGFSGRYLAKLGSHSNLAKLSEQGAACFALRSTYPTQTCTNHAAIMTGVSAEKHGIIGNDRLGEEGKSEKNIQPEMIQVPTLFEIASLQKKKTAFVSGKDDLITLFSRGLDVPVSHKRPLPYLTAAPMLENSEDNKEYYSYNMALADWVFDSLFAVLEKEEPDLTLVNIQSTDYIGHRFGPDSKEMEKCLKEADRKIGELAEKMKTSGMLETTAVFITADHGMTETGKAIPLHRIMKEEFPDAGAVVDGRNGYLWIGGEDKDAMTAYFQNLEGVRDIFENGSEKARALSVDYEGGPDLFLESEPGYVFLPEPMISLYHGQHGSRDDSDAIVPLIAFGAGIPSGAGMEQGDLRCIAPMVCTLMDLPMGEFDVQMPALLETQERTMFQK